jgi:hypothetical protein
LSIDALLGDAPNKKSEIMLYAMSVLLGGLMGWSPPFSIWLTALVFGLYSTSGGLGAVVMTRDVRLTPHLPP